MRDELLNREIFYTLDEAKVLVERWRHVYNRIRPHSSLGCRPPAPDTKEPWPPGFAPLRPSSMWCAPRILTQPECDFSGKIIPPGGEICHEEEALY